MLQDPMVIAAAIVTVIAALVTGTVTIISSIAAAKERSFALSSRLVVEATSRKADVIIEKATEIHTLTNSNLSRVTEALNLALERISGLEKLITAMTNGNKKITNK